MTDQDRKHGRDSDCAMRDASDEFLDRYCCVDCIKADAIADYLEERAVEMDGLDVADWAHIGQLCRDTRLRIDTQLGNVLHITLSELAMIREQDRTAKRDQAQHFIRLPRQKFKLGEILPGTPIAVSIVSSRQGRGG